MFVGIISTTLMPKLPGRSYVGTSILFINVPDKLFEIVYINF
jgi:hypothetical protein